MAIAMAESGGIGVIHKNNTIEDQATHVRTVKKYESGIVKDPITIESTQSIEDLVKLTSELNISGMPVVDNGVLKGIVTSRDFRYADNLNESVSSIMTPLERLITVNEGTDQDEVKKLMYQNRIEKVLVLDKALFHLELLLYLPTYCRALPKMHQQQLLLLNRLKILCHHQQLMVWVSFS